MIGIKNGNNILFDIKDKTLIRVENHKKSNLVEKYKGDSKGAGSSFKEAISSPGINIISEFKRASPSAGDIARHLSSDDVAQQYISSELRLYLLLQSQIFSLVNMTTFSRLEILFLIFLFS